MTTNDKATEQIKLLAKLVEDANKNQIAKKHSEFGKCEWIDINGEQRCNSPWSQFQCEQVNGTFTEGEDC